MLNQIKLDLEMRRHYLLNEELELMTEEKKQTPLHYAAMAGCFDVVKYLVEVQNFDPSLKDAFGRSAFFLSAQYGNIKTSISGF